MIDQHLAELQLLNSAVVIHREQTNGSSPSADVSSTTRANGHSSAAATLEEAKKEKEKIVKEKMERRKWHGDRRGLSGDVEQLSKIKHRRRPSDIESLSPEVRKALQSTFGSKLNEIRSRIRPCAPSPPPRAPSPPPSPLPPPLQESTPVPTPIPTPPPSPARPPAPAAAALHTEKCTFVERLADRDGAYMLIAYFSAIFLSGFILLSAEEDDGDREGQEEICGGLGFVESKCERLFGYILPAVLTAMFFIFALIFFVFDVSYSFFNILMATKDVFTEKKNKHMSTFMSKEDNEDLKSKRTGLSAAGLTAVFVIDLGFIIVSSALLWLSKTSTVDPLHTICDKRRQLLWMVGLLGMDVMILFSAIKSFREPHFSTLFIQTAAKRVFVVLCVLLACTAAYDNGVPESKEARICVPRTFKEIQMYEPLEQCGPMTECLVKEGPELLKCHWCPPRRKGARRLDWCEANQQCDWPLAKQIQVYGRKDVCSPGFPRCDWPLVKQIQPYEDKHRCTLQELVQCEWPWLKQIQLYEHEERCQAKDFSLQRCDWPRLKQIQLFEGRDRCPLKNPYECEWPLVKQIQLFESEDYFSSRGMCRCFGDLSQRERRKLVRILPSC